MANALDCNIAAFEIELQTNSLILTAISFIVPQLFFNKNGVDIK